MVLSLLVLLFLPPAVPHLLSLRDPGPPARPADAIFVLTGGEGRIQEGYRAWSERRGEGTVHPRCGTEGPRHANRARSFADSRRGALAHPRGGVVREHARKRLLREIRGGRGEILLGDPRDLRLPRPPRGSRLSKGPSAGRVALRDPGASGGGRRRLLAVGEAALPRGVEILGVPDPPPVGVSARLRRLGGRGSVRGSPCGEPARLRFTSLAPPLLRRLRRTVPLHAPS